MTKPAPPKKKGWQRPFGARKGEPSGVDLSPPVVPPDVLSPTLASVILLLGTVGVGGLIGGEMWVTGSKIGFPLDDTFIHLRVAENVAQHGTFGYNPGEQLPVSTSPLWVMLMAPFALFGVNLMAIAKILGAISYVLAGYAAARLAQRVARRGDVALFAGFATLCAGRIGWSAMSGMETLAFTALSLLALERAIVRDRAVAALEPWTAKQDAWLGALFGFAALLRPEGALLFGVWLVNATIGPDRRLRAPPLYTLLSTALLVAPWILFCLVTTGAPLPTTIGAKRAFLAAAGPLEFLQQHAREVLESNPLLAVFAPVGLVLAMGAALKDSALRLLASWALAMALAGAAVLPADYHHGRYLMPLLPVWMLLGALGLFWTLEKIPFGAGGKKPLVRVGFMILAIGGGFGIVRFTTILGTNVTEINTLQVHTGLWANQRTEPHVRIAANDIGALGYLGKRKILDVAGIATPGVAKLIANKRLGGGQDDVLFALLAKEKPDYLVVFPDWYPHITSRVDVFEPAFWRKSPTQSISGGNMLVAYKAHWDRHTGAQVISRAEADARLSAARGEVKDGRAAGVWKTLVDLEKVGPLDRHFRRALYVVRAEGALALGDCGQAKRSVMQLDWLAPPDTFRVREGIDVLEQRAQACKSGQALKVP